jgi:4-amino-4-deoxy-L-arabinose transferase-like glycosyltransferase
VAVALFGLAWTLLLPPWQAPDENNHFAYTQSVAERFELPGDPDRPFASTEQERADFASGSSEAAQLLHKRPQWSAAVHERWRDSQEHDDRDNGGGTNPANQNPPAYYLYEAAFYEVASSGTIFDRLWVMRLGSLLCLLIMTTAVWLLAGELFGRSRPLQLVAATVAGLFPMVTHVASSVTPDSLLYAEWSLVLWLGTRILRRGLTVRDAVALFLLTGLAVTTKATSFALVPAVVLVLVVGAWRLLRARTGGSRWRPVLAGVGAFAVPAGAWFVVAAVLSRPAVPQLTSSADPAAQANLREFLSYVWQYYLPKLPFQEELSVAPSALYDVWIRQGWAAFGWLEIRFPEPTYTVFAVLTALIGLGALVAVVRRCGRGDVPLLLFYVAVAGGLLLGLHWTEYNELLEGRSGINQGRYLFPLVGLFGIAVAATLALVRGGRRLIGAALVVGAMIAFQLFSLGIVLERFYVS